MIKAFLITGCSTGIGRATAEQLLRQGYTVYATARKLESIVDLEKKGAAILTLDVTDISSIEKVKEKIEADDVQLFGLVNNAGYGQMGPIEEVTAEQAFNQMNTNVLGMASVTRTFLPLIRKHKEGIIINVSSIAGKVSMPLSGWYCASKFAVEALSDALRLEMVPFGVKVVVVEPGPIRTSFGEVAYSSTDHIDENNAYTPMLKQLTAWSKKTLNDREAGKPIDVANVIVKILRKRNPKPRYRVTRIAKFLYILRRLVSDRFLDNLYIRSMKLKKL